MTIDDEHIRKIVREELDRRLAAGADDEELTITEAVTFSRLSSSTITRWIRTNRLKATGSGKATRIRRGDLRAAMGAGRQVQREKTDDATEKWLAKALKGDR